MNRAPVMVLACLMVIMTFEAHAQEKGDLNVFGGYSHLYPKLEGHQGWNASMAVNVSKHFALAFDVSGHYYSGHHEYSDGSGYYSENEKYKDFNILIGPRYVNSIHNRVTPFAHFLVGLHHRSDRGSDTIYGNTYSYDNTGNFFAGAIGGGVDIRITNRLSVRAFQLDCIFMKSSRFFLGWDGYVRASFGVVLRLNKASKS
jgi:hypothetical protein